MADLRALEDDAVAHFAKGRFDRAASVLRELCALEPDDPQLRVRFGDALLKSGDRPGAIAAYRKAAEAFARAGHLPRAIAVCKRIVEVEPGHEETQRALARLYAKKSAQRPQGAPAHAQASAPAAAVPVPERAASPEERSSTAGSDDEASLEFDTSPRHFAEGGSPQAVPPEAPPDPGLEQGAPAAPRLSESSERAAARSPPSGAPAPFRFSELDLAEPEMALLAAVPQVAEAPTCAQRAAVAAPQVSLWAQGWFASPEAAPLNLAELEVGGEGEGDRVEIAIEDGASRVRLPEIPLFSNLPREAFVELVTQCALRKAQRGETIIAEGSVGGSFFAISAGAVRVVRKRAGQELVLARLGPGAFFGEMALLSGAPRTASAIADEATVLLEISAGLMSGLVRRFPSVAVVLRRFARERFLANALATSRIFAQFSAGDRRRLLARFKSCEVQPGECVLEEGRPSDGLYVVVAGALEVRRAAQSGAAKLAELREGELFGEISLMTKGPATATVAAAGPAALLRLPREDFDELIVTYPQVLALVSELCDERLRQQAEVGTAGPGLSFL